MVTLSDRFDQIDAKRVVIKPVMTAGAAQRRDDVDSRRKVGRQTQFEARRQGISNAKPAMRAAQVKAGAPRQQQQMQTARPGQFQGRGQGRGGRGGRNPGVVTPRFNNQQKPAVRGRSGPAGRGGGSAGRGRGGRTQGGRVGGRGAPGAAGRGRGRGGRSGGRGNKEGKPKDLDEGLDEYWFKAGKGPDPKIASLDRGLDNYWNTKSEDAGKTGDKAADGATETVEMSDAAATAADAIDPDL